MLVRAFFQAARVCKDACVRLDCFGGARSAGWVCVVDTREICIAIDAIERKLNIDTNLLTQQIALAAHESHLGQKLRYFFHVRSFVLPPKPIRIPKNVLFSLKLANCG